MRIGAALILIAIGAIMRFAVATVSTHGFDIHTIGDILMVVGVVGLLVWLFVWVPRRSQQSSRAERPPIDGDGPPAYHAADQYDYPTTEERRYQERYPR